MNFGERRSVTRENIPSLMQQNFNRKNVIHGRRDGGEYKVNLAPSRRLNSITNLTENDNALLGSSYDAPQMSISGLSTAPIGRSYFNSRSRVMSDSNVCSMATSLSVSPPSLEGEPNLDMIAQFSKIGFSDVDYDEVLMQKTLPMSFNGQNIKDRMRPILPIGTAYSTFSIGANANKLITRKCVLPDWAKDENGNLRSDCTVEEIICHQNGLLEFVRDKQGCQFLESIFKGAVEPDLYDAVFNIVACNRLIFLEMSEHMFGNFFVQLIIEKTRTKKQQRIICDNLCSKLFTLCFDKFACRVVQNAIEKLCPDVSKTLILHIPRDDRLRQIFSDQNGNHVIQKMVREMEQEEWLFVIDYLTGNDGDVLFDVCSNKYGCRVVQTIVEVLSDSKGYPVLEARKTSQLLRLMDLVIRRCKDLSSNEFANYIVQHVLSRGGHLNPYRDTLIEKCLMKCILSMSQEKYSSHVIEKAFANAPLAILAVMMEEIFDGYIPDYTTGRTALDIMMFHQYGNYVVQGIINRCRNEFYKAARAPFVDNDRCYPHVIAEWIERILSHVLKEQFRLQRFSSGNKIILDMLHLKNETDCMIRQIGSNMPPDMANQAEISRFVDGLLRNRERAMAQSERSQSCTGFTSDMDIFHF